MLRAPQDDPQDYARAVAAVSTACEDEVTRLPQLSRTTQPDLYL